MRGFAVRRNGRRHGADEGASTVETAITLNLLLLLIFGIVEFGTALYSWNTMQLAVEQVGRYVMINNNSCSTSCAVSEMQLILTSAASCTTPTAGQICVSATGPTASNPPTMTLTAAYNFNLLAPFIPSVTMTSQATFPLD